MGEKSSFGAFLRCFRNATLVLSLCSSDCRVENWPLSVSLMISPGWMSGREIWGGHLGTGQSVFVCVCVCVCDDERVQKSDCLGVNEELYLVSVSCLFQNLCIYSLLKCTLKWSNFPPFGVFAFVCTLYFDIKIKALLCIYFCNCGLIRCKLQLPQTLSAVQHHLSPFVTRRAPTVESTGAKPCQ